MSYSFFFKILMLFSVLFTERFLDMFSFLFREEMAHTQKKRKVIYKRKEKYKIFIHCLQKWMFLFPKYIEKIKNCKHLKTYIFWWSSRASTSSKQDWLSPWLDFTIGIRNINENIFSCTLTEKFISIYNDLRKYAEKSGPIKVF